MAHDLRVSGFMLGLFLASLRLPGTALAQATITLTAIDDGATLSCRIDGLVPGARYTVLVITPADTEYPLEIEANTNGTISDVGHTEPSDPDGTWTIEVHAVESNDIVATAPFIVENNRLVLPGLAIPEASPRPAPTETTSDAGSVMTVLPYTGPQPADFRIQVTGLIPGTAYRLVIRNPDPDGRELSSDVTAGSNGTAGELYTRGPTDPSGIHTVELRDKASGAVIVSATFTIAEDGTIGAATPVTSPAATAIVGLPDTGGGGTSRDDGSRTFPLALIVVVTSGGFVARAMLGMRRHHV